MSTPGKTRVEDHPGADSPGVIAEKTACDAREGVRQQPQKGESSTACMPGVLSFRPSAGKQATLVLQRCACNRVQRTRLLRQE
jgi:hypothetical protein